MVLLKLIFSDVVLIGLLLGNGVNEVWVIVMVVSSDIVIVEMVRM